MKHHPEHQKSKVTKTKFTDNIFILVSYYFMNIELKFIVLYELANFCPVPILHQIIFKSLYFLYAVLT